MIKSNGRLKGVAANFTSLSSQNLKLQTAPWFLLRFLKINAPVSLLLLPCIPLSRLRLVGDETHKISLRISHFCSRFCGWRRKKASHSVSLFCSSRFLLSNETADSYLFPLLILLSVEVQNGRAFPFSRSLLNSANVPPPKQYHCCLLSPFDHHFN